MEAIFYLWRRSFINRFKDLKRHPGKIVGYLFIIALLGLCVASSFMNNSHEEVRELRSISELGVIIYGFFALVFISQLFQSLSSGSTLFRMSDVNFMFVSPISQRKVLAYGLLKQLGTSFFVSFFILFQTATLNDFYGVGLSGVLILFAAYYILTISGSIISMAIYAVTSGSQRRKNIVKYCIYALFIPIVISVILSFTKNGTSMNAIVEGLNSDINEWIPFMGWLKGIAFGLVSNDCSNIMVYVILTLASLVVSIVIIFKSKNNYYEDVLVATETLQSKLDDAKAGKTGVSATKRKIKVKNTGINKGTGAITFFYKHMLERRRARRLLIDTITIIQVAVVVVVSIISKEEKNILIVFGATIYIQMFLTFADKWTEELTKPYVYMIPDSSFKKLISIVSEGIIKTITDGIIIFVIAGIMLKVSAIEVIVCIAARVGFAIIFIAGDVLSTRILGVVKGNVLLSMLVFLITILTAVPGIVFAAILGLRFESSIIGLLVTIAWNFIASMVIVYLCRNLLDNIEQNL